MAREARNRATTVKKGGGFLGKLLCLLLGFILGIVGTIGGVGGLGYYVVTQVKIKDAFETINGMTGADITYTDFVTEQIGEGSPYDLVMTIVEAVEEIGNGSGSLETLDQISPFVGTSIQGLIDSVKEFGVILEYDVLMKKPFGDLGTYLGDTLNGIEIAPILNAVGTEASGLIALICYGEEGKDFYYETDADGNYVLDDKGFKIVVPIEGSQPATVGSLIDGVLLNERLGNLSFKGLLSSFLSNGGINADDTLIRTLAYGIQGEDYVIDDKNTADTSDDEIVPLPIAYAYNDNDNTFTAPDGSVFSAVPEATDVWQAGDFFIMRNEGDDSNVYEFEVIESKEVDGETKFTVLYQLGYDEEDGARFIAYKGGIAQMRGGLLLSDVIGENANLMDAIAPIRLGDLIGLDGNADPIILTLAYGTKGTDYTIDDDKNIILLPGGKSPLTIGELTSGQLDFLDTIQLASLLGVELKKDNTNDIMVILAYGNNGTHFYFNDNEELVWNVNPETNEKYAPRTIGDLLGNQELLNEIQLGSLLGVELTKDNTNDIMVILAYGSKGTHYVINNNDTPNDETDDFIEWLEDENGNKYGPRTIQYLMDHASSLLDELELGSLLGVDLTPTSNFNDFMLILAYGSKGTHYDVNDNGTPDNAEDDSIVWLKDAEGNEYGPRTIQYLIDNKDTLFEDLLSELQLGSLLGVELTPASDFNDFMVILAYGSKGTHYDVNNNGTPETDDDSIVWLKDKNGNEYGPRTIQYLIDNQDTLLEDLMNDLQLGELLGIELTPSTNFSDIMVILAYGDKGTHYDVNNNGTPDNADDDFIVWLKDKDGNEYGPRTIQYLVDNKDNLMNEIELGSLLGVELTPASDFNDFMVILAYGSKGTHYDVNNNGTPETDDDSIVWLKDGKGNEYGPRTIQYLIDNKDTLLEDLMNDLQLGELLGIELTPSTNFSDIMVILAYGDKGTHYDVNDNGTPDKAEDDFIVWLKDKNGNEYGPRTIQYLVDNKDNLMNEIELGSLLGVELTPTSDFNDFMVILAYGSKGTHYDVNNNGTPETDDDSIVWLKDGEGKEYAPRSIQYLIDHKDTLMDDLMNDLELGELLGIELTPATNFNDIMVILAYGDKGTHYDVNDNGTPETEDDSIVWLKDKNGNEYGPRTIQYLVDNKDNLMNEIELGSLLGVELTPASDFNDFMVILAYGSKGTHYDVNDNGTPETEDDSIVWLKDGEGNEYAPRSIQYLIDNQDNLMDDLMNDLELGELLGIELTPATNFNDIMVILAYGDKGTHYDVNDKGTPETEDDSIVWLKDKNGNEYAPRTIQYLVDNKNTLMNEIKLGSLLGVELTPASKFSDFMVILAYGSKGTHYDVNDNGTPETEDDSIVWLKDGEGNEYEPRSIQYLIDHKDTLMDDLMNDLQLGELLDIELTVSTNFNDIMVILAFGEKGTHYDVNDNGTPETEDDSIVWLKDGEGNEYAPRTVQYLIDHKNSLMDEIKLSSLLGIELTEENADDILTILAFGSEGKHYDFDTNGKPVYRTNPETNEKYAPRSVQYLVEYKDTLFDDLLNDIELATVFDIDLFDDKEDDAVLVSLVYGNENEDYTVDYVNKKINFIGDSHPVTIGELTDKGIDVLEKLYLDAILGVNADSDGMMRSLAYGSEYVHYQIVTVGGKNTIQMLPKTFTVSSGNVNNQDGKTEGALGTIANGVYPVYEIKNNATTDNVLFYVKADSEGVYYGYNTEADAIAENKDARILNKKTQLADLSDGSATDLINRIELGAALGINLLDDKKDDTLMVALAYGTEGEHYEIIEVDGVKKINWLNGHKARTIADLQTDGADLLNDLSLASLLNITAQSDQLMRSLAFGNEGVHYEIDTKGTDSKDDDEIVMLPIVYTLKDATVTDQDGKTVGSATAVSQDGVYTIKLSELDENEENIIRYAKVTNGNLYVYDNETSAKNETPADRLLNAKTSLAELRGNNAVGLIERISLSTILDVSPLDPDDDPLMVAIVYGNEGEHYEIDDKNTADTSDDELVLLKNPRTIGSLKNDSNELIDSLYLDAVLNLDPEDPNTSDMMLALALGNEGTHYKIVNHKAIMLERKVFLGAPDSANNVTIYDEEHVAVGTLGQKVDNQNHTIYEITEKGTGKQLWIRLGDESNSSTEAEHYHVYASLADAEKDVNADENGEKTRLYHEKTKFKDLRTTEGSKYIERIELSAALGIDLTDKDANPMIIAIIYGNEDEHYEVLERDGEGTILSYKWKTNPETNLPYHARTINDLKDANTILDGVYIDTILGVNNSSDEIMKVLAWGPDYQTNKVRKTVKELKKADELINDIYLDTILGVEDDSDEIMKVLAWGSDYKTNKVRKTVAELKDTDDLMNDIYLDTVLGLDASSSAVLLSLAYGPNYFINNAGTPDNLTDDFVDGYTAEDRATLGKLKTNGGTLINNIRMDKLIKTDGTNAIMNYFVYGTTKPDANAQSRTLGTFMESSDSIVDNMLNELVLADVLPDSLKNNKFLMHIDFENTTLEGLGAELDNLAVQDILAEDLYEWAWFNVDNHYSYVGATKPTNNGNYERCIVGEGNAAIKAGEPITIGNTNYASYVYCNGGATYNGVPLQGVWKYLLTEKNVGGQDREIYCSLTALGGVSNNLTKNMQGTSLKQLNTDGIINLNPTMLAQGIIILHGDTYLAERYPSLVGLTSATPLGNLTVAQSIDYIGYLLSIVTPSH